MDIQSRKSDFIFLGQKLIELSTNLTQCSYKNVIKKATIENSWFTSDFIALSFKAIGESLTKENINNWLSKYSIPNNPTPIKIGLILAGNIPLVGLHDILCVLMSGNQVIAKLSVKDQLLYSIIKDQLVTQNPEYENRLIFTDGFIKEVDAIIATGSNNSSRYFEYYFGKYPNIIRKNRNSLGLISGNETTDDLELLADDIFTYFGLGCRNVSFLWLPINFPLDLLFKSFTRYSHLIHNNKYANNYDYQKAIMLMNQVPFFDNGLVMLRENDQLSSPIGVVHYQYYKSINEINNFVSNNKHNIQCIVSKTKCDFPTYELGGAQKPELWDYADNVDTMEFLLTLK
ncbi:MAG: acyl-CoA reductase [Salinivirgaceae bacterium]